MKTVKINIPEMQSDHCQARVKNAIGTIEGVSINNVAPGAATISFTVTDAQKAVTEAIESAGYNISDIESGTDEDAANTFAFKTNINCGGCVAKVTPFLNEASGIEKWDVDTTVRDKKLTVKSNGISEDEIINTVKAAGFKIEAVEN